MPLSAQTTAPPDWLHSLELAQTAPGANPLVLPPPPQTPLTQLRLPQH
jgi:hypothetical protein